MANTEAGFRCPKEAVRCFFFKLLTERGFPKAAGVALVLNVLLHSLQLRHNTGERD